MMLTRKHIMIRTVLKLILLCILNADNVWGYPETEETFDFIVVGSGVSGSVIGSRLSENGKYNVLILEAGQLPDPDLDVPALSANVSFASNAIKTFQTVPQRNAGQSQNGIVNYFAGRVLGGGSSVNMMFWNRGHPSDYDNWAKVTSDSSWSYKSMLKYLRRPEDYEGDYPSNQHGYGGPITVSRKRYSPGEEYWFKAGKHLGYTVDVDQNGPQQISFTSVEYSKNFGRRVSAYTSYIKPILDKRSNLKVILGAHVSRLQFQGNRAIGVLYRMNGTYSGRINYVTARKEIILSAGVIGSPAILLRSGVGPKEVLDECRISPVKILPVGENLHDHVSIPIEIIVRNKSLVFDEARDLNAETWNIYNSLGDGPYSLYGGNAQAFVRTPRRAFGKNVDHLDSDEWPNLQPVLRFGRSYGPFSGFRENIRLDKNEGGALYIPFLTRPKSRGTLRLNASDIEGDPLIDFQYLTHPQDVQDLLHGIKLGLQIIEKTPAFQSIGARYPSEPIENCRHLRFRSDEYWHCFIKQNSASGAHAAGTCRMGKIQDPNAVVDSSLRVIGIQNLRVADTSIMPAVVNANTQVAAYAVGEKCADMILRSHT